MGAMHGSSPGTHDHGHGQDHRPAAPAARLRVVLVLTLALVAVETAVAFLAGSVALLGEAAHMLVDAVGVGLALAALRLAGHPSRDDARTFGWYRIEVLAALVNALLLFGAAGYVLVESTLRLVHGSHPDAAPMLAAALLGLAVNFGAYLLLREDGTANLNVAAALTDVMADALGSAAVVAAALVVAVTGWSDADPIAAGAIGVWILPRTWMLAGRALRVLLQVAPAHVDLAALRVDLGSVPGVVDVHDVHVWTLTSAMDVASAHLVVGPEADHHAVLDAAILVVRDRHGIEHATLQVEPLDHGDCSEISW